MSSFVNICQFHPISTKKYEDLRFSDSLIFITNGIFGKKWDPKVLQGTDNLLKPFLMALKVGR